MRPCFYPSSLVGVTSVLVRLPFQRRPLVDQHLSRLLSPTPSEPRTRVPVIRSFSSHKMEEAPSNEHIYEWHEYVENLDHYRPGGYHPVHLGDLYSNERYQVVHKLGFGSYSTVWLARDLHLNRYVTLKIVVARASGESSESRILRHLRQTVSGDSDSCITSLRDEFYIDGPNGRHLCLATEPAACSVADSKDASLKWMFPLEIARAISAQTILALQTIHSSGVIHGGIVHLSNSGGDHNLICD